jgi:tRNA pseudouridine55 synthase
LGEKLGPGGHLRSLRRLSCGPFDIQNALSSKNILNEKHSRSLLEKVIPLNSALPHMREIMVERAMAEKVRHGYQPTFDDLAAGSKLAGFEEPHFKIVSDGNLVAVMKANKNRRGGHDRLDIARVFS